ncbi:MAG: hypothetical protein Q7J38_05105 [Gallionella sp.]|nr:hypothetical protein [Gallionella sp.]
MENHHIKLVIEGLESDEGHVRLEYFLKALKNLYSSLSKLDCKEAGGKRASDFVVVGLSHNSPATVELEARQIKNRPDVRALVFNKFNSTVSSIQRGIIPDDVDYSILEDLREIAAPVGRGVTTTQLSVGNEHVDMTEVFAKRIDVALADVEYCHGSVEGRLEQINIHAGANVFTVYPEFGASSITCHFPHDLREDAIAAVNRRVSVYGNMKYRKNAPFPHHIDIEHLEIYQDADSLPSFDDLRGIAPSIGDGTPSEEVIRELRNGWQ